MFPSFLRDNGSGGIVIMLHVVPRASRTEIAGLHGGAVKLKVHAPPADGAANRECRGFLARLLGVPVANVTLRSGSRSRDKTFAVAEVSMDDAMRRISIALPAPAGGLMKTGDGPKRKQGG